ncbi:hypothetical protein D3C71_1160540 [compost metagenome]
MNEYVYLLRVSTGSGRPILDNHVETIQLLKAEGLVQVDRDEYKTQIHRWERERLAKENGK